MCLTFFEGKKRREGDLPLAFFYNHAAVGFKRVERRVTRPISFGCVLHEHWSCFVYPLQPITSKNDRKENPSMDDLFTASYVYSSFGLRFFGRI